MKSTCYQVPDVLPDNKDIKQKSTAIFSHYQSLRAYSRESQKMSPWIQTDYKKKEWNCRRTEARLGWDQWRQINYQ